MCWRMSMRQMPPGSHQCVVKSIYATMISVARLFAADLPGASAGGGRASTSVVAGRVEDYTSVRASLARTRRVIAIDASVACDDLMFAMLVHPYDLIAGENGVQRLFGLVNTRLINVDCLNG